MTTPTATTVNRPTDVKQKERDINNKLQLYGMTTAFGQGKMPTNRQIDIGVNSLLASRGLNTPSKRLSPEGQKLVTEFRDVIEKFKILVLTKNDGNLLQDFIWQTSHINPSGVTSAPQAPLEKETAKQHGNEALEGLRTLGTLIISNGQFRKLLNDATILIRDIAGDAAQNAANRVNPSEDQLRQVDEPAADNTWHDNPNMSPGHLKNQMKDQFHKQKPVDRGGLRDAMGNATQAAHPGDSRDPSDVANLAVKDPAHGTQSGVDARSGLRAGVDTLRDHTSQNVPDETKDRARHAQEHTKDYLRSKMPKERRDRAIWRLKKMVVEIQGHPDYQRAIDTLLYLAEEYKGHTKNLTNQTGGAVKDAHVDPSLQAAEADLKTLIERFANNTSLDDFFDSVNTVYRDADRDPELRNWFREMTAYIRRSLKEQGYMMQDSSTDEFNRLYDRGHYLLREKYKGHMDHIVDEIKYIAHQFEADPQNRAFGDAVKRFFHDVGTDENGQPTLKRHLLTDVTDVILPAFFENVRYVPIPRIEYTDPMIDAIVENLVIESDNLTPNVFEFAADNYWRWGRKKIPSRRKNKVMLSISGVQMDLKDVSYYIRKKQGFPSVTDTGVMDIYLGGEGLSFKVHMENADEKDASHFFKINNVDINMKHLKIKLKQSRYKLLFNLFKPLLLAVVRPAILKVAEKQIRDTVNRVDGMLWTVHQEAKRAEADAKRNPNPSNVRNIYQRYASAASNKVMQGKEKSKQKAKATAADKKVNVALTQEDSIFPQISLPGGISTKATEYKQLARQGDKWESPIFSLGSSRETSNVPKIPGVTRRTNRNVGNMGNISLVSKYATDGDHHGNNAYATGNNTYANGNGTYASGNGTYANGGTAGFSNQVSEAFNTNPTSDYKLNAGHVAPTGGHTTTGHVTGGHTTLGMNNPVLTGAV